MNGDAMSEPPVDSSSDWDEPLRLDAQEGSAGEQHAAGEEITPNRDWGQHSINIRFSVRTLLSRYYVVVLAGPERRPKSRRQKERKRHPMATLNNLLFVGGLPVAFIFGILGMLLGASIAFAVFGP